MNKYLVPICEVQTGYPYIQIISAKSIEDCKDKLSLELNEAFSIDDNTTSWEDYIQLADEKYQLLIGEIVDIEEL